MECVVRACSPASGGNSAQGARKEEEGVNMLADKTEMSSERGGGFRKAGSRHGSAMLLGLPSMFVSLLGSPSPAV